MKKPSNKARIKEIVEMANRKFAGRRGSTWVYNRLHVERYRDVD